VWDIHVFIWCVHGHFRPTRGPRAPPRSRRSGRDILTLQAPRQATLTFSCENGPPPWSSAVLLAAVPLAFLSTSMPAPHAPPPLHACAHAFTCSNPSCLQLPIKASTCPGNAIPNISGAVGTISIINVLEIRAPHFT
jgi:hypothetical protein